MIKGTSTSLDGREDFLLESLDECLDGVFDDGGERAPEEDGGVDVRVGGDGMGDGEESDEELDEELDGEEGVELFFDEEGGGEEEESDGEGGDSIGGGGGGDASSFEGAGDSEFSDESLGGGGVDDDEVGGAGGDGASGGGALSSDEAICEISGENYRQKMPENSTPPRSLFRKRRLLREGCGCIALLASILEKTPAFSDHTFPPLSL